MWIFELFLFSWIVFSIIFLFVCDFLYYFYLLFIIYDISIDDNVSTIEITCPFYIYHDDNNIASIMKIVYILYIKN